MGCVVLGVTGGIAAYKTVEVARMLIGRGMKVKVIMTEHATWLVGPATFRAITGEPVATGLFDRGHPAIQHIDLAREAELMLVAPATANILSKMAHGLADDLLSTTLLATRAPILVAPAMNVNMFRHPATQSNLDELRRRGVYILGPASGSLACGDEGEGRMAEPQEIVEAGMRILGVSKNLMGKRVLVTAGGTREPIDPVRYIGNRSSGKMGYELANAARRMGAEVTLVSGPTYLERPEGVLTITVETAEEMRREVLDRSDDCDAVVMAAAVADYTPAEKSESKIKKEIKETLDLRLERTGDILKELGEMKREGQVLVGFAAETGGLRERARDKLASKKVDLLVANDVTADDAGFDSDYNRVLMLFEDGSERELELMPKRDLARYILDAVADIMQAEGKA